jgi:hypothetical protein
MAELPHLPGVPRLVTVRAWGALPAGGAYDAAPLEVLCANWDNVTLYIVYTRAAANGAVTLRGDASPYGLDALAPAGTPVWFRSSLYVPAVLAAGVDAASRFQRETLTYQATAAGQESLIYGPIALGRTCERFRVACAESGAIANPGNCAIYALMG